MLPLTELWLCIWTAASVVWWGIAIRLVYRGTPKQRTRTGVTDKSSLSIFKPIPSLHDDSLVAAVESFVGQLDDRTELLLGVEEPDAERWQQIAQSWGRPQVKVVCAPRPAQFLSPKVSWFHTLAGHATGEWWMWSDADMALPAGGLASLRAEFAANGCELLTTPYIVRHVNGAPKLLEALFVNVEFYPGVLAASGRVDFAMGAGMIFRAEDFRQRANWDALGCRLADDNLLGKTLTPVRVADITLETLPASVHWRDAIRHYARWHKTVRWCRPWGFAGEIVIMPVLGWLVFTALHPAAWPGLVATMQLEAVAAWWLCRQVGCVVRARNLWVLEVWSVLRAVTWLACWLPWPVVFRSQHRKWWSLYRSEPLRREP